MHDRYLTRVNKSINRIPWNQVCGCVAITLPDNILDFFDSRLPVERDELLKSRYESGAKYSIDADCNLCDGTGDINNGEA